LKTEIIGYDYVEFARNFDFTGKRLIKKKEAKENKVAIVELEDLNQSHEQNDDYGAEEEVEIGTETAPPVNKPKKVTIVSKY